MIDAIFYYVFCALILVVVTRAFLLDGRDVASKDAAAKPKGFDRAN